MWGPFDLKYKCPEHHVKANQNDNANLRNESRTNLYISFVKHCSKHTIYKNINYLNIITCVNMKATKERRAFIIFLQARVFFNFCKQE